MTRESRMLLILGGFGVGAVVALSLMAQRYGEMTERRGAEPATAAPASGAAPGAREEPAGPAGLAEAAGAAAAADPVERAARERADALAAVDAWLQVRRAVDDARATLAAPGAELPPESREMLAGVRRRALAGTGLSEADYGKLAELARRWRAGEGDVGPAFEEAFSRRRAALAALPPEPTP